jgi:hypothetical protein
MAGTNDYEFIVGGIDASDRFTSLVCNRSVRQQVGSFTIILSDNNFSAFASLAKYQPVTFTIDDTLIFKGRIDTAVRHWDKTPTGGYITTVSGRDDGGALQDAIISAYYIDYVQGTTDLHGDLMSNTPRNLLTDLLAKYTAQKGSLDPAITLGSTIDFGSGNFNIPLEVDREGTWQGIEMLCQALEGKAAQTSTPVYLDFWVDPADKLWLTQTGEIVDDIDIGGYGGKFIKVRDWTVDALPLKNDVWVYGDAKAGWLPLVSDSYYLAAHGETAATPTFTYTASPAAGFWFGEVVTPVALSAFPTIQNILFPHLYPYQKSGPITTSEGVTISQSTNVPTGAVSGDSSIQIHIDPGAIYQGVVGSPLAESGNWIWLSGAMVYWGMRFDPGNYPDAPWIDLCQQPRNHLNMKNNTRLSESSGEINGFYATVQCRFPSSWAWPLNINSFAADILAEAVDGQTYPMRMVSPTVHYSAANLLSSSGIFGTTPATPWQRLYFPLGPSAGGSLQPTNEAGFQSSFFNWFDVTELHFGVNLNWFSSYLLLMPMDIYFADLQFVKQCVARGSKVPTDSVRPTIITDSTIPNYAAAFNKANATAQSLAIPQSYIDYDIYGRPDLQVGHVFNAEGGPLLIRNSTTTVVKDAGYAVHVKAWKPLAGIT